jgi:hypothetical protein
MEIEKSSIKLLPARTRSTESKAQPRKHVSNYFKVILNQKLGRTYQFDIECYPEIPADSKELLRRALNHRRNYLNRELGIFAYSNRMCWGIKEFVWPVKFKSEFSFENIAFDFEILVKPTKRLSLSQQLYEKMDELDKNM